MSELSDVAMIERLVKEVTGHREAIRELQDALRELPSDNPASDVIQRRIDEILQKVRSKKAQLRRLLEGNTWKVKHLARALAKLGIDIGEAFGKSASKVLGKLVGGFLGAIFDILLDPTPISGVDERVVDSIVFRIDDVCYKTEWYQTKWGDEVVWGPIHTRTEEIPCPPEKELSRMKREDEAILNVGKTVGATAKGKSANPKRKARPARK